MKNRGGREGDKREKIEKEEQEKEREGRTKTVKCKIRHHAHHILINIIAIQIERAHNKHLCNARCHQLAQSIK